MVKYEELYQDVKKRLSEKRFKHSEGVVERAIEYAKVYGVDEEKVKLVAISHDIAKEIPQEEMLDYAQKIGVKLDEIEKKNLLLVHAKIGAKICEDKYGFSRDMVDAISYHTTGKANMSILEKIIYLADATEKNRQYAEKDEAVKLIKSDINDGMIYILKWTINDLIKKDKKIHFDTINAYNFYCKS